MARKKRKKKLNRKLLIILGGVALVFVMMALAGTYVLLNRDPVKRYAQAEALWAAGKRDAAFGNYQSAAYYSEKDPDQLERSVKYNMKVAERLAEWIETDKELSLEKRNQLMGKRLGHLQAAVNLDENTLDAHRQLTDFWWTQGRSSRNDSRRWDSFLKAAEAMAKIAPDNTELFHRMAMAHASLVKTDSSHLKLAEDAFIQAASNALAEKDDDKATDCYLQLYHLHLSQGDQAMAEEVLREKALEAIPDSPRLRVAYAEHLLKQRDDHHRAELEFALAVAAPKKSAADYMAVGEYYMMSYEDVKTGDMDNAKAMYQAAHSADALALQPYLRLAWVYMVDGDPDAATVILKKGLAAFEGFRGEVAVKDMEPEDREKYIVSSLELKASLARVLLRNLPEDEAAREKVLVEVETLADGIDEYFKGSPIAAKYKGSVALRRNDLVRAEKLLRQAYDGAGQSLDVEIAQQLAALYMHNKFQQYGDARKILTRVVAVYPTAENQLAIVRMDMLFQHYEEAQAGLRKLSGMRLTAPQGEEVKSLWKQVQQMQGKTAGDLQIPDTVTDEQAAGLVRDIRVLAAKDRPGALKFAEELYAKRPDHEGVIGILAALYNSLDQKAKSLELIDEALTRLGESKRLRLTRNLLAATEQAEINKIQLEYIDSSEEGLDKELDLAEHYGSLGDNESEIKHLQRAVALDITNELAINRLMGAYLARGQVDEAVELVAQNEKAEGVDPVDAKFRRARLELIRGETDAAIAVLEGLIVERPKFSTAHAVLGQAYLQKGDVEKANQSFQQSYQQNPSLVLAQIGLAQIAERKGDVAAHEHWINRAHLYAPDNAYVRHNWLRYQRKNATPEKLIEICESFRRGNPADVVNLVTLAEAYMSVEPKRLSDAEKIYGELYGRHRGQPGSQQFLAMLADFYRTTGNPDRALQLMDKAEPGEEDKVGFFCLYGRQLMNMARFDEAAEAIETAIKTDPQDARGYDSMSVLGIAKQDWDLALDSMKKVVELVPENHASKIRYIDLLQQAKRYGEARDYSAEMAGKYPDRAVYLALQARANQYDGKMDEALALLKQAIDADPASVQARQWRASLNITRGDFDEAIRDLQDVFRATNNPDVAYQIARLLIVRKDFGGAKAILEEAMRLPDIKEDKPRKMALLRQLASVSMKAMDWDGLAQILQQGRELDGESALWYALEAQMWGQRGDVVRRADAFGKAFDLDSSNINITRQYIDACVSAGQYDKVRKLERLADNPNLAKDLKVVLLVSLGRADIVEGKEAQGLARIQDAFNQCDGSEAGSVCDRFYSAVGRDRYVTLLNTWLKQKDNWAMRVALGRGLAVDPAAAKEVLQKVDVSVLGDSAKLLVLRELAMYEHSARDLAAAAKTYQAVLALAPRDAAVLNNLAYLMAEDMNKPDEAIVFARRASVVVPGDANVADTLGWVYYLAGQYAEAERELNRALELEIIPASRYHLAMTLKKLNRQEESDRQIQLGWEQVQDAPADAFYGKLDEAYKAISGN